MKCIRDYVASETEREQSLILETDINAKDSVVDGMAEVIDNLQPARLSAVLEWIVTQLLKSVGTFGRQ